MKIMVGIDLHSNNALCGLMDESGQRLAHKKLPCELPAILQLLEPYKDRIATIAVESTFNWYWLVDGLQDHGYHVVLANPAGMQPYSGMKCTDDVSDAYFLAELLRLNLLPTGHIHDRQTRPVRDLLRRRLLLVRQRTMLILSFKSLNERTLGQRVSLARVKAMKAEEAQARFTAPADQLLSGTEITLMGHLTAAITKLEQHLLGVAGFCGADLNHAGRILTGAAREFTGENPASKSSKPSALTTFSLAMALGRRQFSKRGASAPTTCSDATTSPGGQVSRGVLPAASSQQIGKTKTETNMNTTPFRNATFAAAMTGSLLLAFTPTLIAQDTAADDKTAAALAMKLQNPVASLISAPIQNNFDWGAGPAGDGFQYKVNIQPVIPF
jgi:hypothetical protein